MKKLLLICSMVSILFVGLVSLSAQPQDNNFQKYYSEVQSVLAKQVENLSSSDLNTLKDAIKLNPMEFGAASQKLTKKMIQDAKEKKAAYDTYLAGKNKLELTKKSLDQTTQNWQKAEERGDSLFSENIQLKDLIAQLTKRVNKLEKESKQLSSVNRKLKNEAIQTKEMLETSRASIRRILSMIPASPRAGELNSQLPATLQDSLTQSECQVAELLKNNFIVTLEGMQRDQKFMDSASTYFKENKRHLVSLEQFFLSGNDLIGRLKTWGSDCAKNYASDIEIAMNDFKLSVENADMSFGEKLAKFFSENLGIIIPVVLIIIVGIVLLVRKSKKGNVKPLA